ncbi:GNAT family N-acetyltransferase [Candidatus Thorarchaeota archaeon]|nr:MAG: GNAT family N-acetyltransferase [Candidatus Thorarchaeota archaeon]
MRDSKRLGLLAYRFVDTECEILTLNTILKRQRVGSNLMSYSEDKVLRKGCKALSVITTNDNLEALAFYQQLRL